MTNVWNGRQKKRRAKSHIGKLLVITNKKMKVMKSDCDLAKQTEEKRKAMNDLV